MPAHFDEDWSIPPARLAGASRDLDLHADRAPLGLRHDQVMVVLDVLNSRVVEASPRQDAQDQGRREEV